MKKSSSTKQIEAKGLQASGSAGFDMSTIKAKLLSRKRRNSDITKVVRWFQVAGLASAGLLLVRQDSAYMVILGAIVIITSGECTHNLLYRKK